MANQFSRSFFVFLGLLLLINLIQAYFTPIIYDEAYYWYYSQDMAWGYFDHPPMVAFLVKLSGLLFSQELGVRFMGCILSGATALILWLLIAPPEKKKYVPHFFLLLFSMVLFNAYGFLSLPDTPLLFFTAAFLLAYKKFLEKESIGLALLLGVLMAALLYSKYHAVLVIFFVLISNLSLLKNKYAWLALAVAVVVYLPHLNWLYQNDFISVKYHLFERPNQPYDFAEFTLGYVLNLIVNFGLLFPWFYWALITTKPKDLFTKSLVYLSYGIIFFFFLSSFQRRAQAQWVIVICVPMMVLVFPYLIANAKGRRWMFRLGMTSLLLLFYARAWLLYQPLIPFIGYETHGPKQWVKTLNTIVGDTPVVFENSYRRAPMYAFYSGNAAFSLNNIYYRQNQYSIDASEAKMQHRRVAYVTPFAKTGDFSYVPVRSNRYFGWYMDDFESYRKLRCYLDENALDLTQENQIVKIYNPYRDTIPIEKIKLNIAYLDQYKDIMEIRSLSSDPKKNRFLKPMDTTSWYYTLPKPKKGNPRFVKFSISENGLQSGINSQSIKVK
ncbi:MAG: glycosyltransferase family 39 protein [Bacteroidota bacterium]